jgi:hypothetical protein
MRDPITALQQYRNRGCRSLNDKALEKRLFDQLLAMERTVDLIGPSTLRYELSELIVQMRGEIWAFDQQQSPWRE